MQQQVIINTEHRAKALLYVACALAFVLFGNACTLGSASQRADDWARQAGLQKTGVAGRDFSHVIYRHRDPDSGPRWHVYIEGDGTPWRDRLTVNDDPTPVQPIMLKLFAHDVSASLYLGRPCYFGLQTDAACQPLIWTQRRYSREVIDSMADALRNVLGNELQKPLVFIGHSGGGTLAMLLAARFPQTAAVVTLAGNLDTDAWCDLHGYSRLAGSLNPALEPPLTPTILQWHYIGSKDERVPARLIYHYAATHPEAKIVELKDFDHSCCWDGLWPTVLRDLETALNVSVKRRMTAGRNAQRPESSRD